MLPASPDRATSLRAYFREVGYDWNGIRERIGIWSPPIRRSPSYDRIAAALSSPDPFDVLGRLFLLHRPVSREVYEGALPAQVRDALIRTELVRLDPSAVLPVAILAPFGSLWIASDPLKLDPAPVKAGRGGGDVARAGHAPDVGGVPEESDRPGDLGEGGSHVLGVNPVAHALLRFTRRDPVGKTLDLGTGNGIQGLAAGRHSGHVWMTDINERAADYARFNAWLNGLENVTVKVGHTFAPVEGSKFDLIVCNPPFIMTPSHKLVCYDNEQELDGFCREIIRRAPSYLEDDGCLQMIFEWAEIQGQPWEARLAEWTADLGCDLWIYRAKTSTPDSYIDMRRDEMQLVARDDVPPVEEWLRYFQEGGVRAIHGGLLLLRKTAHARPRSLRIENLAAPIDDRAGAAVSSVLRRIDFLEENRSRLGELRFELDPRARLRTESSRSDARWKPSRALLEIPVGLPISQGMDAETADFLVQFDGRTTVGERIAAFASQLGRPREEIEPGCLELLERMIERGFLTPA